MASPFLSADDKASTLFARSQAEAELGMPEVALVDIAAAIELAPGEVRYLLRRAELLQAGGDAPGALAAYGKAIALDPDAPLPRRARAELLMMQGRNREAVADFDVVLRAAPGDANGYVERGVARWRSLDFGSVAPGAADGFALLQRQMCRDVQSDCPDVTLALDDLGRAVDLTPGPERAVALFSRADILAERGQGQRALADLDEAVRLRPEDVPYRVRRAQLRQQAGDLGGAQADLDAALGLRPHDAEARVQRARLRQQSGELEGARADLDDALAQPTDGVRVGWLDEVRSLRRAVAAPGEAGMEADLTGLKITGAVVTLDGTGEPVVAVRLDAEAARRFGAYTTWHIGSATEILVGGKVVAAPRILSPITGGSLQIAGAFTRQQAQALARDLSAPGASMTVRTVE